MCVKSCLEQPRLISTKYFQLQQLGGNKKDVTGFDSQKAQKLLLPLEQTIHALSTQPV